MPRTWEDAIDPNASVFFADIDPASAEFGKRYPALAKPLPNLNCMAVIPVPGVVLPQHAAVLTARVRTQGGGALARARQLREIAAASAEARATDVAKLYGNALDRLPKAVMARGASSFGSQHAGSAQRFADVRTTLWVEAGA